MSLVMPRLMNAVAGFISKYGSWPTKVAVPVENWERFRADPNSVPEHYHYDPVPEALARLELIPLPRQLYIAIDDSGRYYDYESGPPVGEWMSIIRASMKGALPKAHRLMNRPITNSYIVPNTLLAAGEYPGSAPHAPEAAARHKLRAFLNAGITAFIDLTGPDDHLAPYAPMLRDLATELGREAYHDRFEIRDNDVCDAPHMNRVLDTIDAHAAAGRGVYVHCWGGIGRTGMVIGCWLVRHGRSGTDALTEVNTLFRSMSPEKVRRHAGWGSPQTEPQRAMVQCWEAHDVVRRAHQVKGPPVGHSTPAIALRNRYRGALLGLATGDALGTTLEFTSPGSFQPISDMVGGGPFRLKPGQWTDDTSMALCLAESLLECNGFDAADQMRRYVRWLDEGYWSSTGCFFDVGGVVRQALSTFRRSGEAFAGPTGERTAGNGSLMRLAPVALFFASDPEVAVRMAADSSRTTHGTAAAVDACRYFAGLLVGALRGAPKAELLADHFTPVPGLWEREPLHPAISAIAGGSFRHKSPPAIRGGTGYVIDTLEAALWAFATTDDFTSGALAAVNLGGDADTTGAVYGQIAGAYYGVEAIPASWRECLAFGPEIGEMADRLYQSAYANGLHGEATP